jgi:hypothetical protein
VKTFGTGFIVIFGCTKHCEHAQNCFHKNTPINTRVAYLPKPKTAKGIVELTKVYKARAAINGKTSLFVGNFESQKRAIGVNPIALSRKTKGFLAKVTTFAS